MTLKLVGIAFEMKDSQEMRPPTGEGDTKEEAEEARKRKLQLRYVAIDPTPLEYFHYAYCYIGLLTGPYYKFRVFRDMIDQRPDANIPIRTALLGRLWQAPVYGVIYLVVSHFYEIDYARTDEFFARAFAYRLLYMVIMFVVFRLRMYFAWIMSECVCMASGLGAYPEESQPRCGSGPTDLEALDKIEKEGATPRAFSFETIHNIDVRGCELNSTVREGMKAWNMSVQFWLAHFIYKRLAGWPRRTFWTMAVSAYWHGVKPGYFLSFFTVPLCLMAESALARLMPDGDAYRWTAWFFKMRCFDYMCMSFLLLDFWATIYYWASIYFIIHVIIAAVLVAQLLFAPSRASARKKAN